MNNLRQLHLTCMKRIGEILPLPLATSALHAYTRGQEDRNLPARGEYRARGSKAKSMAVCTGGDVPQCSVSRTTRGILSERVQIITGKATRAERPRPIATRLQPVIPICPVPVLAFDESYRLVFATLADVRVSEVTGEHIAERRRLIRHSCGGAIHFHRTSPARPGKGAPVGSTSESCRQRPVASNRGKLRGIMNVIRTLPEIRTGSGESFCL